MIVLELNAKSSMSHLLLKPTFHQFSFIEGDVTTFNKFHIDGRIHKEFFDEEPGLDFSLWRNVQKHFLAIIRGKRTPLSFKLVLSLPCTDFPAFLSSSSLSFRPDEIQGLYLNFHYSENQLRCVTGTSMKTFTMDKSLEQEWDKYIQKLLTRLSVIA